MIPILGLAPQALCCRSLCELCFRLLRRLTGAKSMNLKTRYLGISLPHPLIIGSSSLTNDLDMVRQLEDEGAAALVLRSLYEEEIVGEQMDGFFQSEGYGETSAEASSYFPDPALAPGPDEYLEHIHRVKRAVSIPVIASLCGTS